MICFPMLIIYSSGQKCEAGQCTPILYMYIHDVSRSSRQGHLKHGKDISQNSNKHMCVGTGRQEKEDDG